MARTSQRFQSSRPFLQVASDFDRQATATSCFGKLPKPISADVSPALAGSCVVALCSTPAFGAGENSGDPCLAMFSGAAYSVGVHPLDPPALAARHSSPVFAVRRPWADPRVVAIGETWAWICSKASNLGTIQLAMLRPQLESRHRAGSAVILTAATLLVPMLEELGARQAGWPLSRGVMIAGAVPR